MYENLNKRLINLEKNQQNNETDVEETKVEENIEMGEDTLVCDDQNKTKESKKRKLPTDDEDASSQKSVYNNKEIRNYDKGK